MNGSMNGHMANLVPSTIDTFDNFDGDAGHAADT